MSLSSLNVKEASELVREIWKNKRNRSPKNIVRRGRVECCRLELGRVQNTLPACARIDNYISVVLSAKHEFAAEFQMSTMYLYIQSQVENIERSRNSCTRPALSA